MCVEAGNDAAFEPTATHAEHNGEYLMVEVEHHFLEPLPGRVTSRNAPVRMVDPISGHARPMLRDHDDEPYGTHFVLVDPFMPTHEGLPTTLRRYFPAPHRGRGAPHPTTWTCTCTRWRAPAPTCCRWWALRTRPCPSSKRTWTPTTRASPAARPSTPSTAWAAFRLLEPDTGPIRYVVRIHSAGDEYEDFADEIHTLSPGEAYLPSAVFPAPSPNVSEMTLFAGAFGEIPSMPIQ